MKSKLNSRAGELALEQGIIAARAGYKNLASVQLERAAELLPDNADVWLWLAWLANSPENTRRCLQQVLAISPGHSAATAGLIWVNSLTADDSVAQHNETVTRQGTRADSNSASPLTANIVESRLNEEAVSQPTQAVERTSLAITNDVDPRDNLDARPSTDFSMNQGVKELASEKIYDSDGWEVAPTPAVEPLKATFTVADTTRTSVAQVTPVDSPANDEESRRRRWNDLVSRAAEMPLNVRSKSLVVETSPTVETLTAVETEKTPVPSTVEQLAKSSIPPNLSIAMVESEVAAVEPTTAALVEMAVPASLSPAPEVPVPEATVQSRFTDVPAATPRVESSSVTINDSIMRLRQSTTTAASSAPAQEPDAESTADIEKLAQTFSPLTDAVAADGRPLVMVVDDSPTVRKLVSLTLERRGYRVISAFDGVAAIKELGSNRPDLILLDINMPRLDGYRLCKLIKKHEATQSIPVVMLSGKDGMFDKLRGRLVGCSDYITKPFEADALTVKVAKYLTPATANSV